MKGSEKYMWGIVLMIFGSLALTFGIILSVTLVGACLGVPMALVGLPLMVWGMIWAYQGHFQKQQEVISAGIREGIASLHAINVNPTPPPFPRAVIPAELAPAVPIPLSRTQESQESESPTAELATAEDDEGRQFGIPPAGVLPTTDVDGRDSLDDTGSSSKDTPLDESVLPS